VSGAEFRTRTKAWGEDSDAFAEQRSSSSARHSTLDFEGNRNHIQAVNVPGFFICLKVTGDEYPKFAPVFTDEFARNTGIVEALRLKILRVE
jgi:hypothetical protein